MFVSVKANDVEIRVASKQKREHQVSKLHIQGDHPGNRKGNFQITV